MEVKYRPSLDLVLKGISFRVAGGEKIGVVGRTGSGKSTLALALTRMLEVSYGSISIDQVDISKVELKVLREKITVIP